MEGKKADRAVLHSDLNNCYASIECLYKPELAKVPMAVGGDVEARHGIILAKNQLAKAYGIITGEAIWQAKQKCPDLVTVAPHYERYVEFAQAVKQMYLEYTDQVESFGLDESWLDVTGSYALFGSGEQIADKLRERIKSELGITASVGVSFNKIFAKLGSDMKKPDATTVINRENFKQRVWPLPVNELLYIGRATTAKMRKLGIYSIGHLARADVNMMMETFGKWGKVLWAYANGYDKSPVRVYQEPEHEEDSLYGAMPVIKSVGNSTTTPRDLNEERDIKITLYLMAESVASRLREYGFKCRTVQVYMRYNDRETAKGLASYEIQGKLEYPCADSNEIFKLAFKLCMGSKGIARAMKNGIRSLGIRGCDLLSADYMQLSLLDDIMAIQKHEIFEESLDKIRQRHGYYSVRRGIMYTDTFLSGINPKDDHVIHPISFYG